MDTIKRWHAKMWHDSSAGMVKRSTSATQLMRQGSGNSSESPRPANTSHVPVHGDTSSHEGTDGKPAGSSPSSSGSSSSQPPARSGGRLHRGSFQMVPTTIQIALAESGEELRGAYVILPNDPRYLYWWYLTVLMACVGGWVEMFEACFLPLPGLAPFGDVWAVWSYLSLIVFSADMVLHFHLAYYDADQNVLIADMPRIAKHYLRRMFWVDLVATFPFADVFLIVAGLMWTSSNAARYISLLKILHLIRLYRLFDVFAFWEYNMTLGQFQLMLMKNFMYVMYIVHWAACMLYFIAAQEGFSRASWVGRYYQRRFEGKALIERYVYALYFSMCTFSSMGDSDFYPATMAESLLIIVFLIITMLMMAYVMGTVTVLVVKSDKRAKDFRDRVSDLEEYCRINLIPKDLHDAMREHLDIHHDSEQVSDEKILSLFPGTMRRRVLRHLYLSTLSECYLLDGCTPKFLDSFMQSARLELFMPQVQLLSAGDVVNDLFIVIVGQVEVHRATNLAALGHSTVIIGNQSFIQPTGAKSMNSAFLKSMNSAHFKSMNASAHFNQNRESFKLNRELTRSMHEAEGGPQRSTGSVMSMDPFTQGASKRSAAVYLGASEPFGEVSFLAEVPSPDNVWSSSICRVLILSRASYEGLLASYPQQMRKLLRNLQRHAEEALRQEINESDVGNDMAVGKKEEIANLLVRTISTADENAKLDNAPILSGLMNDLTPTQKASLENLKEVQKVVRQICVKMDLQDTSDFLNAASGGKLVTIQRFLNQGLSPNACDYDHRTGLMLACRMGQDKVVQALLEAGADASARDNFGTTAILEACIAGHDSIIEVLLKKGARVDIDGIALAAKMCDCVYENNLSFLRRLLRGGADPDAADYDKRCALHIAAAQGNLTAVKLMVEQGQANVLFRDRWSNTALDEALRVGAQDCVAYLRPLADEAEYQHTLSKWRQARTQRFMAACMDNDAAGVEDMLRTARPPTVISGMMLAGCRGHLDVVQSILSSGGDAALRQDLGRALLYEAAIEGNDAIAAIAMHQGVSFKGVASHTLGEQLSAFAREGDCGQLLNLLRIGVHVDTRDAYEATALHAAATEGDGNLVMVRALVELHGADVSAVDASGATPAQAARCVNAPHVVEYLEWAAAQPGGRPTREAALERWGVSAAVPATARPPAAAAAHPLSIDDAGGAGGSLVGAEDVDDGDDLFARQTSGEIEAMLDDIGDMTLTASDWLVGNRATSTAGNSSAGPSQEYESLLSRVEGSSSAAASSQLVGPSAAAGAGVAAARKYKKAGSNSKLSRVTFMEP